MKTNGITFGVVCFCVAVACRVPAAEAQSESVKEAASTPAVSASKVIVYVPPVRGAPGNRIGGGTRGDDCGAQIDALVPESHVGLTTKAQPILQWYLHNKVECPIDFVLNERGKPQPLVETTLAGSMEPGVHQIDLSRLGVQLEPDVEYEWSVAVVRDSARRSRDTVSGGQVMRRTPGDAPKVSEQSNHGAAASSYAQQGFWYDALAALTTGIEAQTANSELREQRAALLDQVGLAEAAARERAAMNTAK